MMMKRPLDTRRPGSKTETQTVPEDAPNILLKCRDWRMPSGKIWEKWLIPGKIPAKGRPSWRTAEGGQVHESGRVPFGSNKCQNSICRSRLSGGVMAGVTLRTCR